MKKFLTISLVFLLASVFLSECIAQQIVVGARDEVTVYGNLNFPMGAKAIGTTPALMTNMKPGLSYGLSYSTTLFKYLTVGAWADNALFTGWSSTVSPKLYTGTTMSFLSAGPMLGYRTLLSGTKRRNRLGFGGWVTTGISHINIATSKDAQINSDTSPETLTLQSTQLTLGVNAALRYVFNTRSGVNLGVGYRQTTSGSKVFNDKRYASLNVGIGLFYRLHLDKKFKYSDL